MIRDAYSGGCLNAIGVWFDGEQFAGEFIHLGCDSNNYKSRLFALIFAISSSLGAT
jgi:hypothetical protein